MAITASPINLSSVPSSAIIASTARAKYLFKTSTSCSGDCFSLKVVKPRISAKRTVISCRLPPSRTVVEGAVSSRNAATAGCSDAVSVTTGGICWAAVQAPCPARVGVRVPVRVGVMTIGVLPWLLRVTGYVRSPPVVSWVFSSSWAWTSPKKPEPTVAVALAVAASWSSSLSGIAAVISIL